MAPIATVFLLLLLGCGACPSGFQPHGHGCYTVSKAKGSMTQCQDSICSALGGSLAVAPNESVKEFLMMLVKQQNVTAFIGLYESGLNESGDWVWIDGSPLKVNQSITNYSLPYGFGFGEPNNWCNDEDCAALGLEFLPRNGTDVFTLFLGSKRTDGWFDVACSTQLHCLCQEGYNISQDFLMWEFNNSQIISGTSNSENSLDFNRSYEENYWTCFEKRTKCWWYGNSNFQQIFLSLATVCFGLLVFALMGCASINKKQEAELVIDDNAMEASNYGQLLEACDRPADVDSAVDCWVVRGSWAAMLYAVVFLFLAITILCHVNFGIGFSFALDALEALMMSAFKLLVGISACMVQKHLSKLSRSVVQWWILAFALSKIATSLLDLALAAMHLTRSNGGFAEQNGSFCETTYMFSWLLMLSMVFQSIAGLAISRIYAGAVSYVGGIASMTNIIGCSGFLLILGTFGSGIGVGACCAFFVFDNDKDGIDPMEGIAFAYGVAAACQFMAGAATLRANAQLKTYYTSARTITGNGATEMSARGF